MDDVDELLEQQEIGWNNTQACTDHDAVVSTSRECGSQRRFCGLAVVNVQRRHAVAERMLHDPSRATTPLQHHHGPQLTGLHRFHVSDADVPRVSRTVSSFSNIITICVPAPSSFAGTTYSNPWRS